MITVMDGMFAFIDDERMAQVFSIFSSSRQQCRR